MNLLTTDCLGRAALRVQSIGCISELQHSALSMLCYQPFERRTSSIAALTSNALYLGSGASNSKEKHLEVSSEFSLQKSQMHPLQFTTDFSRLINRQTDTDRQTELPVIQVFVFDLALYHDFSKNLNNTVIDRCL